MVSIKATNTHLWGRQVSSGGQLLTVTASGEVLPPKGQEFSAAAIAQMKKVPGFSITEERAKVEEAAAPMVEETAEPAADEAATVAEQKGKKGGKRLVPNKV